MGRLIRAQSGSWGRFGLVVSAICALTLANSRASAHEVGVSRGTYTWQSGTLVVQVTLTRRELASTLPWLRGDTGTESVISFEKNQAALGSWIFARIEVAADDRACPPTFQNMRFDGDGVALTGSYACLPDAARLAIDVAFLSELARGHRHLFRFASASSQTSDIATASNCRIQLELGAPSPRPSRVAFGKLVEMGFEHILTGYDHLLFLVGLVLVGGPVRSLLAAITAFTAAHSLTLAASALSIWTPSPSIVEPCIALSIVYVGIENWFVRDATGRWRITFFFGLVHGFGFASALRQVALPRADVPLALLGFNLGVELAQMAVLAVLLPLVLAARKHAAWEGLGMRACTLAVALLGFVWFVARVQSSL